MGYLLQNLMTYGNSELAPAIISYFKQGKNTTVEESKQTMKKINLTPEQIEEMYKQYKPYVKIAKKMSDEQINAFISNRMPDLSDESLKLIIARVRS